MDENAKRLLKKFEKVKHKFEGLQDESDQRLGTSLRSLEKFKIPDKMKKQLNRKYREKQNLRQNQHLAVLREVRRTCKIPNRLKRVSSLQLAQKTPSRANSLNRKLNYPESGEIVKILNLMNTSLQGGLRTQGFMVSSQTRIEKILRKARNFKIAEKIDRLSPYKRINRLKKNGSRPDLAWKSVTLDREANKLTLKEKIMMNLVDKEKPIKCKKRTNLLCYNLSQNRLKKFKQKNNPLKKHKTQRPSSKGYKSHTKLKPPPTLGQSFNNFYKSTTSPNLKTPKIQSNQLSPIKNQNPKFFDLSAKINKNQFQGNCWKMG
jgi:cell fate (sporulation/competence/biofilm development) regulator YlbF (YheA/YmcA/DUF963 family)